MLLLLLVEDSDFGIVAFVEELFLPPPDPLAPNMRFQTAFLFA